MYIALLKRFWPLLLGAGLIIYAWFWHTGELRKARADERQKVTLAYQKALQDVITKREERLSEVQAKYEAQINRLTQSVAIELRGPPIRMCAPTVSVSAPEDPGTLVERPGRESTVQPSRDLRGQIVLAGERCERLRQQLIAIRELQR